MGEWLRKVGVVDRRPFREKLLPWWAYGLMAFALFAVLPLMLSGLGSDRPEAARQVGLVVMLPLGLLMLVFAWVARKHQRP